MTYCHWFVRLGREETKLPFCCCTLLSPHCPFSIKSPRTTVGCALLSLPSPCSAIIWHSRLNTLQPICPHDAFFFSMGKIRRKEFDRAFFFFFFKYAYRKSPRQSALCLNPQHMQIVCTSERSLQSNAPRYKITQNRARCRFPPVKSVVTPSAMDI